MSSDDEQWTGAVDKFTVATEAAEVQLALTRAATLTGVVRAAGAAVAGATVSVGARKAVTGADGAYRLTGLTVGEVEVRVASPDHAQPGNTPAKVTIAAGEPTVRDLEVISLGTARLRLTAPAGRSLPAEVALDIAIEGPGADPGDRTAAVADGVVAVDRLPPAKYRIEVDAEGFARATVRFTLGAAPGPEVAVTLVPGKALDAFIAASDAAPLEAVTVEAEIRVEQKRSGGSYSTSYRLKPKAMDGGRHRFSGLPTGSHEVIVSAKGCIRQRVPLVVPAGDEALAPLEVRLERGRSVRVSVRAPDGAPAANVRVEAHQQVERPAEQAGARARVQSTPDEEEVASARTGKDGVAVLDGLPRIVVRLLVRPDKSASATQELAVDQTEASVALSAGLTIAGTAFDAAGQPLAGVRINAWPDERRGGRVDGRNAVSGADGTFRIEGLTEGKYRLNASKDRLQFDSQRAVAAGTAGVELRAVAERELRVLVVDAAGAPLAGVKIDANGPVADQTTGPDGTAVLKLRKTETRLEVTAELDGMITATTTVEGARFEDPAPLRLTLTPGRSIAVRVRQADGSALPDGVQVTVQPVQPGRGGRRMGGAGGSEPLPPDGALTLRGLAPGVHRLAIQREQFTLAARLVRIATAGETPTQEVVLPPLGSLRIICPGGVGGHAWITQGGTQQDGGVVQIGDDGTAAVEHLPVGRWKVQLWSRDRRPRSTVAEVAAGRIAEVRLGEDPATEPAPGGATIAGTVTLPQGAERGQVFLMPDDPARMALAMVLQESREDTRTAAIDSDGGYRLSDVPDGSWLLSLRYRDPMHGWRSWMRPLTVAGPPDQLDLEPSGLVVPGTVRDHAGAPVAGAQVMLLPQARPDVPEAVRWLRAVQGGSGPDGRFELAWLAAPGTYEAVAWHEQSGHGRATVTIADPPAAIELTLGTRVGLTGSVEAPDGVGFQVIASEQTGFSIREATVDGDGGFRFADDAQLAVGTWSVCVIAEGFAIEPVSVKVADGMPPLRLALVPAGSLQVTAPAAAPGSAITVEPTEGPSPVRPGMGAMRRQDPRIALPVVGRDGTAVIEGLRPGTWRVTVAGAAPREVAITAGVRAALAVE